MTGLDFEATTSGACRQYGVWLHSHGYTETWQAYDPAVRAAYAAALRIDAATLEEIERVMADPYFGLLP